MTSKLDFLCVSCGNASDHKESVKHFSLDFLIVTEKQIRNIGKSREGYFEVAEREWVPVKSISQKQWDEVWRINNFNFFSFVLVPEKYNKIYSLKCFQELGQAPARPWPLWGNVAWKIDGLMNECEKHLTFFSHFYTYTAIFMYI